MYVSIKNFNDQLIFRDPKNSTEETRKVLDILGLEHATEEDCSNVKLVCARVSTRAAFLVSAGINIHKFRFFFLNAAI